MTKKFKLPVLLILSIALVVVLLASCTSVGVLNVQVKEDSQYKTEYVLGEELDLTGLELVVTRTDGEVYTVFATDVRADLKILNFKTDKILTEHAVILEYKGVSTSIIINVKDPADAQKKYTVDFVTGEGASSVASVGADEFSYITKPADPSKQGYAFDGWYKSDSFLESDVWNFNTDKVEGDTVLYAKWSKLYRITFKNDVAVDKEGNPVEDIYKYVKAGSDLTDVPSVPQIDGKVGRWDTDIFTNVNQDFVVNAIYEDATYTVTFYYMESDGITQHTLHTFTNVPHGTNLAETQAEIIANLNVPQFSTDGTMHFERWSQEFTYVVSNLSIRAEYAINKYDVEFNLNYATENPVFATENEVTYNNPVTELSSTPEREGYAFDGWYKQTECITAWNFNTDRIKGNTVIYAKWIKLYTVRFLVSATITLDQPLDEKITVGNEEYFVFTTKEVKAGQDVTIPELPVKTGYSASWNATQKELLNIQNDRNVIANFVINQYTVVFYNYDRSEIKRESVNYLASATAPTQPPVRTGYTFSGWNNAFDSIVSDLEVTAQFEANSYLVNVVPNNTKQPYTISAVYDSRISLDVPEYSGYHFVGWFTDINFENEWDISSDMLRIEGDGNLTLYAKWLKVHTVAYYDEESVFIGSQQVINGNTIEEIPAIPEVVGKDGGWFEKNEVGTISDVAFDFSSPITSDVVLVRVYSTKVYKVVFYKEIGQLHYELKVPHGSSVADVQTIDDPEVPGKIFIKWDKPLDYEILHDTDFLAEYETIYFTVTWGAGSGITSEVAYGKSAIFPEEKYEKPTKEGYYIKGWIALHECSDFEQTGCSVNNVLCNMVVEPDWDENTYKVEFRDRDNAIYNQNVDGASVESQTKEYGSFIEVDTTVPNPTKVGKNFVSWSVESRKVYYDNESETWVLASEYGTEETFVLGSGADASLIIKGEEVYYVTESVDSLLSALTYNWTALAKYKLTATESGWMVGQDVVTTASKIAFAGRFYFAVLKETTFYADFETATFEISYSTGVAGMEIEPDVYDYGSFSVEPQKLSRDDFVFLGWYLDDQFEEKYYFGVEVNSDLILYARWEASRSGSAGLTYTLNEQGTAYSLTALGQGFSDTIVDVVVANYYNGLPVESVGAEAFANVERNYNIQTIDLPNTLVNIGPSAFMNMASLKEINIPDGVKIIPDNAFNGNSALETVSFGDASETTTIGENAFIRNVNLKYSIVNGVKTNFTLPSSLVTIESGAFYECLGLTEIYIPQSVLTIEDTAFAGANNLKYAVFEKNTPNNLGANVFKNSTSLEKAFRIYVPNVAQYTGAAANANWKLLSDKIYDVNNVTLDGEWSYLLNTNGDAVLVQYLGSDVEIEIPEAIEIARDTYKNVVEIGDYCFDSSVVSVQIRSKNAINENTFGSADSLKKLIVVMSESNLINANYLCGAYDLVSTLDTLVVSPTITVSELFGGSAPTSLINVATLSTGDSVIDGFLANCTYVQNVIISGRVKTIGANAFLNCTALISVEFDNSTYSNLTTIGNSAFNGAISLNSFKVRVGNDVTDGLPETVTTIGEGAFDGTEWLRENSSDMVIIGNGILYRYRGTESVIAIPETVRGITAGAFEGNTYVRQVYVQNPTSALLSEIGESAFENCVNLEAVVLPASIKDIRVKAFAGDTKLATIVIFSEVMPNIYGSILDQTYALVNTHANLSLYVGESVSVPTGASFNVVGVANLALYEGATAEESWVYGDATEGSVGAILIKSLSASETLTVPETINGKPSYEIADYALPRTLTNLSFSTRILNVGDFAFAGVTFLEELTLYNNAQNNHRVESSALMSLFTQNTRISVLNSVSSISMNDLIGGTLPENVKTVNVLQTEKSIANSFLENNEYVENINVTVGGVVYGLEETKDVTSDVIVSIGAKAFRGTKWMENLEDEFIIVLGGNLVDYKGSNPVIDIPETVKEINGGLFESDAFVEIVFLPSTVTEVGDKAFYGAQKITKIFFSSTSAPTIQSQTFDANAINLKGVEVFVPATSYSDYVNATYWNGINPISDEGVSRVKTLVSEKTKGSIKESSYVEYVFKKTDVDKAKLLLSRNYTETYSLTDGTLVQISDGLTAEVPVALSDGSTTYDITEVGNNVFMSGVTQISIRLTATINSLSLANLGTIDTISIKDVDVVNRKIDASTFTTLFNNHNVRMVEYDGSISLSTLFDVTDPSVFTTLSAVKVDDGVTETVGEMLKGWSSIEEILFPKSIIKVGVNSLEDTAWYKNYNSDVFGEFIVLGGSLLYKYKGSAGGTLSVPNQIAIVNTGAFSNYVGGVWTSNVSATEISFSSQSKAHTILDYAFAGCKNLAYVSLSPKIRNVAENAFEGTQIQQENNMLMVSGNVEKGVYTLIKYYGTDSEFVIPAKLKKIASGAFEGNETLTTISYDPVAGSILTTICEDAFNGAINLANVSLPNTLVNVGKDAFFNTKWLANQLATGKDVVIGSSTKGVLYQMVKATEENGKYVYELKPNIVSVTEGALVKMDKDFTIDGVTYGSVNASVSATKLVIYPGVNIDQAEMYSIISKVEDVQTNGQVTLSALIGNSEPLDNVTTLSFFNDTVSIVEDYAYGWENVQKVTYIPYSVVAIGARAFEGTSWFETLTGDGIIYAGGETGSTVIIKYNGTESEVTIKGATGISPDAFRGNENITKITFSSQSKVTEIPAFAFKDCVNLSEVVLNDKIVKFGEQAFENTAWLNDYPSDFLIIDGAIIAYAGEGGAITIPKETKKIYPYVFAGNETITSVTFDANCLMDSIDANLFRNCTNLEEIVLNEYITHVDRSALEGTLWFEQTSTGERPVLTYENSYYGIKRIVLYVGISQSYRITSDVTEIVPTAFSGVTTLNQIVFAEGKLNAIPDGAFEGCTSLSYVTMVDTIEYVGENAFAGTPWYNTQSSEFVIVNGTLIKYNGTATEVVLPATVSAIEAGVFEGKNITSIDMSLTSIKDLPNNAFKGISTLSEVVASTSLVSVGKGAFEGTAFISTNSGEYKTLNDVLVGYYGAGGVIYLPEEIEVIATDAFYGNDAITGIVLYSEVSVMDSAFVGTNLTMVDGAELIVSMAINAFNGTPYENPNENGFSVVNGTLVRYEGTAQEVVIPANVTYIPEGVFTGNELITKVDFSQIKGSLDIDKNAFRNVLNLSEIVFSDNIDYVGARAFYNTKWQNETTDKLIVSPGGKLLAYIAEENVVNIPATVKTFARDVFTGNANITTIAFAQGTAVNIPEYAFQGCSALINVTFPKVAFEIGAGAFEGTAWLNKLLKNNYVVVNGMLIAFESTSTDVVIPATVTKIYDYVFKGNENITSLSFATGSTLTAISGQTFVGCSSLQTVSFKNTSIELLDMGAFEGTAWKSNLTSDFIVENGKLLAYVGLGGDVVIPGTVTDIAENAFKGNTTITSLSFDLSSYLDTIPARAFENCVNLATVNFPDSIREVEIDAFKGTKWINNLNLSESDAGCYVYKGRLLIFVGGTEDDTAIMLPESVTSISKNAFVGSGVSRIYISDKITDPDSIVLDEGALDSIDSIVIADADIEKFRVHYAWSAYVLKMIPASER